MLINIIRTHQANSNHVNDCDYQFQVQQTLAMPNMLERFVKDPEKAAQIREVFTGLYPLDPVSSGDNPGVQLKKYNFIIYIFRTMTDTMLTVWLWMLQNDSY